MKSLYKIDTDSVAFSYWINRDSNRVYIQNSTGTYDCFALKVDPFGVNYFDNRGTVTHLPSPEKLVLMKGAKYE